jgi:hypothetical protein
MGNAKGKYLLRLHVVDKQLAVRVDQREVLSVARERECADGRCVDEQPRRERVVDVQHVDLSALQPDQQRFLMGRATQHRCKQDLRVERPLQLAVAAHVEQHHGGVVADEHIQRQRDDRGAVAVVRDHLLHLRREARAIRRFKHFRDQNAPRRLDRNPIFVHRQFLHVVAARDFGRQARESQTLHDNIRHEPPGREQVPVERLHGVELHIKNTDFSGARRHRDDVRPPADGRREDPLAARADRAEAGAVTRVQGGGFVGPAHNPEFAAVEGLHRAGVVVEAARLVEEAAGAVDEGERLVPCADSEDVAWRKSVREMGVWRGRRGRGSERGAGVNREQRETKQNQHRVRGSN